MRITMPVVEALDSTSRSAPAFALTSNKRLPRPSTTGVGPYVVFVDRRCRLLCLSQVAAGNDLQVVPGQRFERRDRRDDVAP